MFNYRDYEYIFRLFRFNFGYFFLFCRKNIYFFLQTFLFGSQVEENVIREENFLFCKFILAVRYCVQNKRVVSNI